MLVLSISVHSDISTEEKRRKAAHKCRRVNKIVLSYIRLPDPSASWFLFVVEKRAKPSNARSYENPKVQTESTKVLAKGHN